MNEKQCSLCQSKDVAPFFKRTDTAGEVREYWKCSRCWMVYLAPECRLVPEEERARYDLHQNSPQDQEYVRFLKRLTEPLRSRLRTGTHGLDFGCGPGPTIKTIMEEDGFSLDNYDPFYFPDENLLKKLYDFVTCSEVAEHFYQPREEFDLLDGLLKKGGHLGLMTAILEKEDSFEDWWYPREPTHVCFYQIKTLNWLAQWKGWTVEYPAKNVAIFSKL